MGEWREVPLSAESGTRDSDPLHEVLQGHLRRCDQCRREIESGRPRENGQRSRMCGEYQTLIEMFTQGRTL